MTCVEVLGFILDTHIHLSAPSPHTTNASGGRRELVSAPSPHTPGARREMALSSHQLPLNKGEGTRQTFQELLSSCAAAEIVSLFMCNSFGYFWLRMCSSMQLVAILVLPVILGHHGIMRYGGTSPLLPWILLHC